MPLNLNRQLKQGRNEACWCGSGLKFKLCHGDINKQDIVKQFAQAKMNELIDKEKEYRNGKQN